MKRDQFIPNRLVMALGDGYAWQADEDGHPCRITHDGSHVCYVNADGGYIESRLLVIWHRTIPDCPTHDDWQELMPSIEPYRREWIAAGYEVSDVILACGSDSDAEAGHPTGFVMIIYTPHSVQDAVAAVHSIERANRVVTITEETR